MISGPSNSSVSLAHLQQGAAIESAGSCVQSAHVAKLSPVHLSKQTLDALKADSPDKIQSAITDMAAGAIADGSLNLCSTEHNEATFKLLLNNGNTSPGELLVHTRKNEQQRYDILELKHKSYASGPTETVVLMERSHDAARSTAPQQAAMEKSKKLNSLLSTLGNGFHKQNLPRLSEYARQQIHKRDAQFVGQKVDRQGVRQLYQKFEQENRQLDSAQRKTEPEIWKAAVNQADLVKRSGLSARHQMAIRQGKAPLEAKAAAALSMLYTPIGMARKGLASNQLIKADQQELETRRQLDALPRRENAGVASRPKRDSLESLALADISSGPDKRLSDTRPSRVEPDEPDDLTIKAGAEAYQALSPETRAALDAILVLLDNQAGAGLPDLSENARHSLDQFRALSSRLSFVDTDDGGPVAL